MKTRLKYGLMPVLAGAAVLFASATQSRAATPPELILSDGLGNTLTVDSSGTATCVGSCTTSSTATSGVGAAGWTGTIGVFNVEIFQGVSKPTTIGSTINLGALVTTGAAGGTLTARFTDVNFEGLGPVTMSAANTLAGNVSVTYTGYVDSTNTPFGTQTTVGTIGPFTSTNSQTLVGPGPASEPYSLTDLVVATLGANSSFSLAGFQLSGTPPPPLSLGCATSSGQVGVFYDSTLVASGGFPPYTFAITSGSLPPGLNLNTATGEISGTPTTAGPFSFTAQVTDSSGNATTGVSSSNCGITVTPAPPPPLNLSCAGGTGQVGVAYSSSLVATGGTMPYTFGIISGSLPPGLILNTTTGAITGTPTTYGQYSFTAQVTDSTAGTALTQTSKCTITIAPPALTLQCAGGTGQVNQYYSSALVAGGGTPPYTFAIIGGSLPPGLNLNTSTGAITGTPTTPGTFDFTAQVTDSTSGTALVTTSKCSIAIAPLPLTLQCAAATGQVGQPYSSALVASGGTQPYTFAIISGSLPAGLSLNTSTGAITGTPTTPGPFSFTAQVTDSTSGTALVTPTRCTITIAPLPLTLQCAASTGQVGHAYSSALAAGGGTPPYTFAIISGSLPPGLSLNASTGGIAGTPTTAGTYSFTAQVTDSTSGTALVTTSKCSIVIAPLPLTLQCAASTGQVGQAYSSALVAGGGTQPYKFAIISGSLPTGLTLNTSTGAITGTPTAPGTSSFTAQVTDSTSGTALVTTSKCSITIAPLPLQLTCAGSTGQVNQSYSSALVASGGTAPYKFAIISGSLPPGLSLNTSTGAITGTPTTAGTYSFTAQVTDSTSGTALVTTSKCSIVISPCPPPPLTASCNCGQGTQGQWFSETLNASGGTKPYKFEIVGGSLPPGLSLNSSTGQISGTPTHSGTYNFEFKVTDATGKCVSVWCSIQIAPPKCK